MWSIHLADDSNHMLFREPCLPHRSLRIGSQSLNLSVGRISWGWSAALAVGWVIIFAVLIHGIRLRRRDHIHSGFRYRGRRAVRVEMAFAGKPAGGSGKVPLI
jgi:hypothetical protein